MGEIKEGRDAGGGEGGVRWGKVRKRKERKRTGNDGDCDDMRCGSGGVVECSNRAGLDVRRSWRGKIT
jgi:hypothetical protein